MGVRWQTVASLSPPPPPLRSSLTFYAHRFWEPLTIRSFVMLVLRTTPLLAALSLLSVLSAASSDLPSQLPPHAGQSPPFLCRNQHLTLASRSPPSLPLLLPLRRLLLLLRRRRLPQSPPPTPPIQDQAPSLARTSPAEPWEATGEEGRGGEQDGEGAVRFEDCCGHGRWGWAG